MGNLGKVAMDTCIMCNEPYQILLQSREGKDAFGGQQKVCTGGTCDKCKKTMEENIVFHCDNCHGLQVLKAGTLGLPAGTRNKIYACSVCTKEVYGKEGLKLFNEGKDSDFILFAND